MQRAAMDVGTNSCRLLIADIKDGLTGERYREIATTRIGKGLSATGRLDEEGMSHTLECLHKWALLLSERNISAYQLVGTSAMREAVNGAEFAQQIATVTGLTLRIISGDEEAQLSYAGVKQGLALPYPPLVGDLGGGSTEFMCFGPQVHIQLSLKLGAVRAHELGWGSIDYQKQLQPLLDFRDQLKPYPLVMVGGTATSLAAIDLQMREYDWEKIQGHMLSREQIANIYERLRGMSLDERRHLPGLLPERADIMPFGAGIILSILEVLGKSELMVADTDLLEALLWVG